MAWIERKLLLKLRDRFRNFGLVKIQFTEQEVRERKFRIKRDRFLSVLFGDRPNSNRSIMRAVKR